MADCGTGRIYVAFFATLCMLLLRDVANAEAVSNVPAHVFPEEQERDDSEEKVSLWELGVAGGALYGPDYPASEEDHLRGIALPYVIYRGALFRLGDNSIASIVPLDSELVELDVSVHAAFDADSRNNDAREGMPDLDYLFEVGPQVTIHLVHGREQSRNKKLDLNLQARSVFSTDLSGMAHRGYVFSPELEYRCRRFFGAPLDLRTSLAPIWASEDLMDYFYEVRPRFVRHGRPAFDAKGGYLGTELGIVLSWDVSTWLRLNTGMRLAYHGGAANEESPLFREKTTVAVGASFRWAIWRSQRTVAER